MYIAHRNPKYEHVTHLQFLHVRSEPRCSQPLHLSFRCGGQAPSLCLCFYRSEFLLFGEHINNSFVFSMGQRLPPSQNRCCHMISCCISFISPESNLLKGKREDLLVPRTRINSQTHICPGVRSRKPSQGMHRG